MPRGTFAKSEVENKIAAAFGTNYVGNVGGKLYVWADDMGEKVQICLSMTCPKTFVDAPPPTPVTNAPAGGWDFEAMAEAAQKEAPQITQSEKDNIERLRKLLDL